MEKNTGNDISRKEFLNRTGGILGAGITGISARSLNAQSGTKEDPRYRVLGRTGLKLTTLGYGTTETENQNVLKKTIDSGINFIDTGRMYVDGKNEEMIGKVIQGMRDKVIIQTKFHRKLKDDSKAIEKSVDESLKALKTDYIDIMLLHAASTEEEINSPAIVEALTRAKEKGKIGFTGFSSHTNQIGTLLAAVKTEFYDVAMVAYNHAGKFQHTVYEGFNQEWDQKTLEKEMSAAVKKGMGIIAMKTCSAGPYKASSESKAAFPAGLSWILKNKNISSMAVWMGNFRELEENIKAIG